VFAVPTFAFANHGKDLDCKDFATQEEAQKHWDEHGSTADNDPERLDKDGNGIPCKDEGSGGVIAVVTTVVLNRTTPDRDLGAVVKAANCRRLLAAFPAIRYLVV